ncbi:MAG: homoaconitate hydratase [Methanobrevibacter sp.]|uniref:homocitrate synthase family protein n=1 Tax=Methanobrevibacter sp. TaxID=66852 RepID=UPI0025D7B953|nr:homocitrate synthase family protein [Methanobrevibacter sp.]MBR3112862.1 homoaconitate hydratase [Methanobrevibacter sp.]MBR6993852.1 homoaconitate hydratase [Methanobrevibacter sp.]
MQYFISHYNKESELTFPEDITIYDTTLRDGEQTPGVCFSFDEKLEIARKLDQFKIHQIEAGFPIVSEKEKESVKAIANEGLDATILGLTRTKPEDIDAALDCDVDGIITFVGTSDIHLDHKMHITRQDAINLCETAVDYAKDHGLFVAFSAEDATRTDIEFLKRIYSKAQECGADRVHIADTTGAITPQGIDYLVKELVKDIDIDIAVHLHNDFGLAVINSITGVLAGAKAVSTTVNGIGERAGNASLEELIMAMKILYGKDYGFKTKYIKELSDLVAKASGLPIPYNKPVVGNNVFRHESGIHVDAVIEEPLCYEPYLPELVGQKRQLVLGKHSGCRAVRAKLNECELDVSDEQLIEIVKQVKKSREEGKYINDQVFKEIVKKISKKE